MASVQREDVQADVRRELARGEYLSAYDIAVRAKSEFPDDIWLHYAALLALARSGAVERAAEMLADSGLLDLTTREAPEDLVEDLGALGARVAKDRALRAVGPRRRQLALEAAEGYEAVFHLFGHHYPCINAATMYLVAGDPARARSLATEAIGLTRVQNTQAGRDSSDDYWGAASAAEASLILGDLDGARLALDRAARCEPVDLSARAGTRRQLRLICHATGVADDVLDVLGPPAVIHYCGHRILPEGDGARFAASDESRVAEEVGRALERVSAGFGYGSLACGADIVVAEALLERDAELHVFLPFAPDDFVSLSVRSGGERWIERFHKCLDAATSRTQTATDLVADPEVLFDYCARVAMGQALIRAAFLDGHATQLAIYDGQSTEYRAGTTVDVHRWQDSGHPSIVIRPRSEDARPARDRTEVDVGRPLGTAPARRIVAMLFADFKGFSKLDDFGLLAFGRAVLTKVASVLDRYEASILHRNTWGDGLHVVFADVVSAAHCALDLQREIGAVDPDDAELPGPPLLRIGMHVGPVFERSDPVLRQPGFVGTHITRTARIEPRTPEGSVYVTNQFAALLALEKETSLSCDYVGHIPAAKDYGTLPMYVLRRNASEG